MSWQKFISTNTKKQTLSEHDKKTKTNVHPVQYF